MIFIFGGKYQGKKDFAIRELGIAEASILGPEKIRDLILDALEAGEDPERLLPDLVKEAAVGNLTVIMDDVSQGLVPIDEKERKFREANGRFMIRFAEEAEAVYRVFCGLGRRIK